MGLPLANVQTNDTFQTWLTRTNEIIVSTPNTQYVAANTYVNDQILQLSSLLSSNVSTLNTSISQLSGLLTSNVATLNDTINTNISQLSGLLTSNVTTLNTNITANVNSLLASRAANTYVNALLANTNSYIDTKFDKTGGTVSGSITIVNAASANTLSVSRYIDLSANTTLISHNAGRLFYDGANESLAFYNDESEITLQLGKNNYLRAFNNSGSPISKGVPVYLSGATNGDPTIAAADASSAATLYAIGITAHAIEDSTYGYVTVHGTVDGINTSGISAGSTVHVAPGGGFQAAAPSYPNYAHEIGFVVTSDATNGSIYVDIVQHYLEQLRIANDLRVEGNFTVEGNFNVLGTENLTTITNLEVADTFVYLSRGDTVTANSSTVTGLDDLTFKGHYNATNNYVFYVKIDSTGGASDLFSWSLDNFSTTEAANVALTAGSEQPLRFGISVLFNANTGHTAGDTWTGAGAPTNTDVGLVGNRNTGNTGVGYTHMGVFFDVTDTRFKFFEAYRPEVSGNINTGHETFTLGQVQANNFIGSGFELTNLNATELTSGTVPEARLTIASTSTLGIASFNSNTFTVTTGGQVTIKDDSIALSTKTTGDYVASVAGTAGRIQASGTGEGATVSVDLSTAGAGAASYSSGISAITVDAYGRVTSVTGSANYSTTTGTVTSVGITGTHITVSGSPITTSGTITISLPQAVATSSDVQFDSFGVGTAASGTTGEIRATNNITAYYSDQRLKKNIRPIDSALDKVMQISGVLFENNEVAHKFGYTGTEEQVGVIAQEIEQVLPHVVTAAPFDLAKDDDGNDYSISGENYKTVRYEKLVPLLIQAIKELKQIVDNK